jgi:hypothetical protein
LKPRKVICRGPFSTRLALKLRNRGLIDEVVFDARGAYTAEINEYNVIPHEKIKQEISSVENEDIRSSDQRLAVSQALINHWKEKFDYKGENHVVIPCTLNSDFIFDFPSEGKIAHLRKELGYSANDLVFVYSGSSAGWQSFELVDELLKKLMDEHPNIKLLVLSSDFGSQYQVMKKHRERVFVKWVPPSEVKDFLLTADVGILYRERSITNKVASPVKFAEYLSCGLKVLISDELGDYSDFSAKHDLKYTIAERPSYDEKKKIHDIAMQYFRKESYKSEYLKILN